MFNWLFSKKKFKPVLSKVDYWKELELSALFDDLDMVGAVLGQTDDTHIEFIAFKDCFIEELEELEWANYPDFSKVWLWFSPDGNWDRLMGRRGLELGKSIYKRADRWKRNQDFLPGSIVCLNGEYGVVLQDFEGGLFGLIRWDTDRPQDTEDWRGIWSNFVTMGGKVLEEYEFRFINIDGSLKRNLEMENRNLDIFKEEILWLFKPGSKVLFNEESPRLSEEFKSIFPVLTTLIQKARARCLEINGVDYLLFDWEGKRDRICGWLNSVEDPESYSGELSAEHEVLIRCIGGIKENFGLSASALSDNQEWMFLGSECSLGLGDYEGYYEMRCEETGFDQIDSSSFMVFAKEANGAQMMYDGKNGKVYLFSHDHSFDNVTFLPGQPEYTYHTINNVETFVDYVEMLAEQWLKNIK